MALDKRTREQMLELCGEIHEDDGVDPRDFFKSGRGPRKQDHKAKQLCRQAAETLDQVLSWEIGDSRLACLRVVSVQPAPDASRLLVTVMADCTSENFHRDETEQRLAASSGRLRTAVASAITRKKAPMLVFVLLGPKRLPATTHRERSRGRRGSLLSMQRPTKGRRTSTTQAGREGTLPITD